MSVSNFTLSRLEEPALLVIPLDFKNESKKEDNSTKTKVSGSSKIVFEKIILPNDCKCPKDLRGSVALTCDDQGKSLWHVIIYIAQLVNAFFNGKSTKNLALCHAEVILGNNNAPGRDGQLKLAHSIQSGIKTTSEDHRKIEVITALHVYRPVDEKIRDLFAKFAKQTTINFKKEGINPGLLEHKAWLKQKMGQFSYFDMVMSIFHAQEANPIKQQTRYVALAAADLLKGDKFKDENGILASFFCTSYMLTLMQGSSIVSQLTGEELKSLANLSREKIADYLADRIQAKSKGDLVAAIYWENEFMQYDARHTMSYSAGDMLDRASAH